MGGLFRRLRLQDREFGSHLDRFTGKGAFGGLVAKGLGPGFRPADVVVTGGGFDGERGDALEEFPAGGRQGWVGF